MSVRVTTWAFDTKVGDYVAKFILVKLADNANDEGVAWPSLEKLCADTEIPERTIKRKLAWLEAEGFIQRVRKRKPGGQWGATVYVLHAPAPGATVASGTAGHPGTAPGATTRALVEDRNHQENQNPNRHSRRRAPQAGDPVWDALSELFGEPTTRTACSLRGKTVQSLLGAGASADEVKARALRWPRLFENATLTETALEKHWHQLAPPKRTAKHERCPECEMGGGVHTVDCSRVRNGAVQA